MSVYCSEVANESQQITNVILVAEALIDMTWAQQGEVLSVAIKTTGKPHVNDLTVYDLAEAIAVVRS